jgi:hypothetical protein
MVARQQHVGHAQAAKLTRPGVLGAFHQALGAGEGILPGRSRATASTITIAATSPPEST